jgi:peptidyl-prolyl cis-trans isomerase A (cyclophilin A)
MRKVFFVWLAVASLVCSPIVGSAQTAPSSSAASAAAPQRDPGLYMTFQTDMGNITCKLYEKEAPITVRMMVGLALGKVSYIDPRTKTVTKKKLFDGLTFHRVIPEFMIQGGDPLGTGLGNPEGPGFPYRNETNPDLLFDAPGLLGMANAGPNTNGSQFFITPANAPEAMPAKPATSGTKPKAKAAAKPAPKPAGQ